ncbi:hypothetical protein L2E82_12814 [Cichorium intybus]|uniref:Uncharacterized protein n=1 Tax=Cichorium intybus TaxID=13427 RepID=A0ACB9GGW0_CICIN|nr:hypothetical protein L2E82_12814 [Cichorium intybus]
MRKEDQERQKCKRSRGQNPKLRKREIKGEKFRVPDVVEEGEMTCVLVFVNRLSRVGGLLFMGKYPCDEF